MLASSTTTSQLVRSLTFYSPFRPEQAVCLSVSCRVFLVVVGLSKKHKPCAGCTSTFGFLLTVVWVAVLGPACKPICSGLCVAFQRS